MNEEKIQGLFDRYLDNLLNYFDKLPANEKFMFHVEAAAGVQDSERQEWRKKFIRLVAKAINRGQEMTWENVGFVEQDRLDEEIDLKSTEV